MKILMATMKMDIGGAETHILELSRALCQEGHEVTVVSNGGSYVKILEESGVKHVWAPLHTKKIGALLQSKKILAQLITSGHFDIVHAHARIPAFLLQSLQKKYHFPFVTTAHSVFATEYGLKYITSWGDKTIAVSDDIKKHLMDVYHIPSSDIRVTVNGIDMVKFSPQTDTTSIREEFGIAPQEQVIVLVSRLDESRSLAAKHLIAATPDLAKSIPDLRVVIVGGGDDFEVVQQAARQANESVGRNCVILTGSRTDIHLFAALGKLFVGVSRAALEAMAAECPVIMAGNEGFIGLFEPSKLKVSIDTNFCFRGCQASSTEEMKSEILRFFSLSPTQQKELGVYSRGIVATYYSVQRMMQDALCVYQWALSKQKEILIAGYYGHSNMGDESILSSIIHGFRETYESPNLTVLCKSPNKIFQRFQVRAISRFRYFTITKHLKHADMLVFGGGSLLQDRTSQRSLNYYLYLIRIAKRYGCKVMIYANGLGPFTHASSAKRVAKVLNGVDVITLRDHASYNLLRTIGVKNPNVCLTADPVFSLLHTSPETKSEPLPSEKSNHYLVLSIRPWHGNSKQMSQIIASVCNYAYNTYQLSPVFLPMQEKEDLPILQSICKMLEVPGKVLPIPNNVKSIEKIMESADVCIGMRLHSLIFASMADVPMIGLEYDPKISAFIQDIGGINAGSVAALTEETLRGALDKIMSNHEQYKNQIAERVRHLQMIAKKNVQLAIQLYLHDHTPYEMPKELIQSNQEQNNG